MYYESYEGYLRSDAWHRKAQERAKIDLFRCCMCGCMGTQTNPLETHHITYRNIYKEDVNRDLVTLCSSCHRAVHRMMNRCTDPVTGKHGWKDELRVSNHVLNYGSGQPLETIKPYTT